MVFSASSTTPLLGESGDSAYYLKRTLIFGAFGLLVDAPARATAGCALLQPLTPLILAIACLLLLAVLLPGRRHRGQRLAAAGSGAGPLQIQPSELAKVALVLYGAPADRRGRSSLSGVRPMMPVRGRRARRCLSSGRARPRAPRWSPASRSPRC